MKTIFYSLRKFERQNLSRYNNGIHELVDYEKPLNVSSANLSKGFEAASLFITDEGNREVLDILHNNGIRYLLLRSKGYDHIDIDYANHLGLKVFNVADYSPYSVAEHAICLIQALNRKIIISNGKVKNWDFSVEDLVGFDLNGETVGILGTGKIGSVMARILHGFGCRILAWDMSPNSELVKYYSVKYVSLRELFLKSGIISIHLPLTPATKHLIDYKAIQVMRKGVIIINTARGGIINTEDMIKALGSGYVGGYGADVYEFEKNLFFENHSDDKNKDEILRKLIEMKNVIITPHQGFLTENALKDIARCIIGILNDLESNGHSKNMIMSEGAMRFY